MDFRTNESHEPATGDGGVTVKDDLRASNLYDLLRQACAVDPKPDAAVSLASKWIREDAKLFDHLIGPMIRMALQRACYHVRHNVRSDVKASVSDSGGDSFRERLAAQPVKALSFLDAWQMPDGRSLADYTGAELLPVAEEQREQATGFAANAKFYSRLAKIAGDRKVGVAVKVGAAKRIWKELSGR